MTTFWRWFDDLNLDVRYAIRSLAKHRGFTATALCALAVGIGANTAIFSVVSGVLLQPLPFAAPERLVQLYQTPAERGEALGSADVEEFRTSGTSFEALAGYNVGARFLRGPDGSERVMTVEVERGFFTLLGGLGAAPLAGRTFGPADLSGLSNVAVAGEAFWRRRLGGDLSAIGKPITVDDEPLTVIGVMPDNFQFPYSAGSLLAGVASQGRTDLWILREPAPGQPRRGRLSFVTGRLKANVTSSAAQSESNVIFKRLEMQYPDRIKGLGVRMVPLAEAVVAAPVRRSLFILFGAVSIVLALACANVANLLLVRETLRSREVAARLALGASPLRVLRQFLTESILLSLAGGAAGLVLAWWGAGRLLLIADAHIPRSHEVGIDWHVFLFLLGACVLTGVVFGLAPALSAMRTDPQSILKESATHNTMSVRQKRFRDGLVVAEVALAFVLGVGATLLVRELVRLQDTETGMVTENVATFHIGQRLAQGLDGRQFYEIAERAAQLPGVRNAGFIQLIPLQSWGWRANSSDLRIRGRAASETPFISMELRYVTPGYFEALGIPIKRGRAFTADDKRDAPRVILINEAFARAMFSGEDPIGRETNRGTIVGIAGDVRQVNLDRPALPEIYYPIAQNWSQVAELGMSLVVRTEGPPLAQANRIREVIRQVNSNLAVFNVKTMDQVVADSLSDFTLYLLLMAAFAAAALFLASTGAYGVIAYVATSRTREFAIRTALGAERAQVIRMVLLQAGRLIVLGIGFGLLLTFAATPLLQNLPVGVRPPDFVTTLPVGLLIGVIAAIACLVPARRAALADPIVSLRHE